MDRIQGTTATTDHQFTEGDPAGGIAATIVSATWLNGVQNELVHIIEEAGITPDAGNLTQVKAALDVLYSGAGDLSALTAALAAETSARTAADSSLVSGLASVNSRVTAEETARAGADASLLSSMQAADNNLQGLITAEVVARQNAVTAEANARVAGDAAEAAARDAADVAEVAARAAGDAALTTALGAQQIYTRWFSNGLMDFFPLATPDFPADILSQSRIVHHKNAAGKTVYAEMFFHWSATFAGSANAGWTIPDSSDALGADIDSALREVWGIGPTDEWKFPYIHGTLQCAAKLYTVSIYHQVSGPLYSIQGWDQAANRLPFGDLRFLIPGENL